MEQPPIYADKTSVSHPKKERGWVKWLSLSIASTALLISILSYFFNISSFEIENRAYIYVQSIAPSNIYEPFFEIKFKNYGKSPAKEIKLSKIEIFSDKKDFLKQPLQLDSNEVVLLISNQEISIRVSANKTYYSIAEENGKVFIVGKITYKDIFDETHQLQYAGWLRAHGDNQYLNFQGKLNNSD